MLSKDNEIDNWRQRLLLDEAEFSAPGKAASVFEQIVEQTVNQRNKKKRFKVVQLVAASIVAVLGLSVLISQFWKDAQLQQSNNEQVKSKLETPKLLRHELNDMNDSKEEPLQAAIFEKNKMMVEERKIEQKKKQSKDEQSGRIILQIEADVESDGLVQTNNAMDTSIKGNVVKTESAKPEMKFVHINELSSTEKPAVQNTRFLKRISNAVTKATTASRNY